MRVCSHHCKMSFRLRCIRDYSSRPCLIHSRSYMLQVCDKKHKCQRGCMGPSDSRATLRRHKRHTVYVLITPQHYYSKPLLLSEDVWLHKQQNKTKHVNLQIPKSCRVSHVIHQTSTYTEKQHVPVENRLNPPKRNRVQQKFYVKQNHLSKLIILDNADPSEGHTFKTVSQ